MPCKAVNCGRDGKLTRGYCPKHYYRLLKHGDAEKTVKIPNGTAAKYFEEVVMTHKGPDCLRWPYCRDGNGYGVMYMNGRSSRTHILACERANGPRPTPKHEAAHSCGNGHLGCCSPHHVRWATSSENKQDRKQHGTYQYGALNPSSKLTEDDVRKIWKLKPTMTHKAIAEKFGVGRENISAIFQGRSWKHLRRHP